VLEIGILEEDGPGCEILFAWGTFRFSNIARWGGEEMDPRPGKAGRCTACKVAPAAL
jgi:hypothetical protein